MPQASTGPVFETSSQNSVKGFIQLGMLQSEGDVDFSAQKSLSKTVVKKIMRYFPLPDGEAWRTSLLVDLL